MGYSRPGAIFIFWGPSPEQGSESARRVRSEGRARNRSPAQDVEETGIIMAVDIVKSRSRIGIRLTPPSLFSKKLSVGRHLCKSPAAAYLQSRSQAASRISRKGARFRSEAPRNPDIPHDRRPARGKAGCHADD